MRVVEEKAVATQYSNAPWFLFFQQWPWALCIGIRASWTSYQQQTSEKHWGEKYDQRVIEYIFSFSWNAITVLLPSLHIEMARNYTHQFKSTHFDYNSHLSRVLFSSNALIIVL